MNESNETMSTSFTTPSPATARSEATVETHSAQRYLTQLSKHFAHKIAVEASEDGGSVFHFECGTARLRATDTRLSISVESPDIARRQMTEDVVASHLVRFAFREQLGPVEWAAY